MDKVEKAVIDNEGVWPFEPDDDCILRQKSTGNLCGGRESFYCDAIYDLVCTKDEYCTKVVCMISDGWSPSSQNINHEQPDNKEGEGVEWDGDMPPVGVWVDLVNEDEHVEVMCHGKGTKFCGRDKDGYIGIFDAEFAEPIQSHRDKCIEAATKVLNEMQVITTQRFISELYDAGCLRLPNDKEGE